ncbi:MAG: DASS family sodium-coupled anion symporter [Proteobacteria bacterium]|nr:DASS family sodium-coupled anion symporter [Pseudomonadota bacterium]
MSKRSQNIQLCILFILGTILWQLPAPEGLTVHGWHLLIIFMMTIIGVILGPVPMSVTALLGGLTCVLTKTLTLNELLGGFSSSIIWIVVLAFFIARCLIKTGLGRRVAYFFISKIGHTTIGLSYGLICTEFLLSPMIPSVTARGGGIIYPVARSIIDAYGAGNTQAAIRRTGAFIIQICFHAATITSAMFVTAMAGNPLAVNLASTMGVEITWATWALGAIVPGLVSLLVLPLVVFMVCPPDIRSHEESPQLARRALAEMGPLSRNEIYMLLIFVLLLFCWIMDAKIGLDATTSALIGVVSLLLAGVLTWDDAISEKSAWDTMVWFAILLTMSGFLGKLGVMQWLGTQIQDLLGEDHSPTVVIAAILGIYIYIHYFFASITAHITVFFVVFSGLLVSLGGMQPLPAAIMLAYASSLSGSLTHYGNSVAPIFYGAKYLTTMEWWKVGFVVCTVNVIIWIVFGYLWWSLLGWI